MCGLAGYFSFSQSGFSKHDLENMYSVLAHRGPDSEGYFQNEYVGLGHRRLSVVDLSAKSNQPFLSSCGRYLLIYNGEVYNAAGLAKQYGLTLQTTSDTEVIVELFSKIGPQFVSLLNGMFVIVIYDKLNNELHIYRDRLGIKPLYYYFDHSYFIFGSEIKSLLALPYINKKLIINFKSISSFLHLGFFPEPLTIYKDILKFPSGKHFLISEKGIHENTFWNAESKVLKNQIKDFREAKNELKELLEKSVRSQLISDVPLGIFLSGGVDSSLIAAIAQKISPKPIKTFTVGLKDSLYNESKYGRNISKYIGAEHYDIEISKQDIVNIWDKVLDDFDQPFGDSSAFPTFLLSHFAKQHITVGLSGEGSDELFMGYGSYVWAQRLNSFYATKFRQQIKWILSHGGNRAKRASSLFNYSNPEKLRSHIFSQEQYLFSEYELNNILNKEYWSLVELHQQFYGERALTEIEQQSIFDLTYYVKDDLLLKIDIASMLTSLEVRVPFLDNEVIDFAINLDQGLKLKNKTGKFLVKELLSDFVPKTFFDRPKQGFSIPLSSIMKNELKAKVDYYLSDHSLNETGIFQINQVKQLLYRYYTRNEDFLYHRIYLILVLQRWFMKNKF